MTWRDRLGLISVRVDDKERVGTGFWITPNRILTARHVILGASSLRIFPVTGGQINLQPDAIIWEGGESLDAALLKVDHPKSADWPLLDFAIPIKETSRCEAAGFPQVAYESPLDGTIGGQVFNIRGSLYPPTAQRPILQFSVEEDFAFQGQLGGISGGPVMVNGRLHGLLRGGPTALSGDTLHVVSIHSLRDIPEFARKLCLPAIGDRCAELEANVRRLLSRNSGLAMRLTPRVQEELQLPATKETEVDTEALTENLCKNCEPVAILRICTRLIRQCIESNEVEPAQQAEKMLAFLFPLVVFRQFQQRGQELKAGLMHIPYFEKAFAEFLRAAIEGRPMEFDSTAEDPFQPRRAFIAPKPPAAGGSLRQQQQEMLTDLHRKLFGEESTFERLLDDDQRINLQTFDATDQVDARITIVRNLLAFKREEENEIFYLLVERETAKTAAYSTHAGAFFASIRDLLPDLEIVVMAGEPKQYAAETASLQHLRNHLKNSTKRRRSL